MNVKSEYLKQQFSQHSFSLPDVDVKRQHCLVSSSVLGFVPGRLSGFGEGSLFFHGSLPAHGKGRTGARHDVPCG